MTSTDATASGDWSPPRIVTTTTISFDFEASSNGPDRPPSRAVSVSSDGSLEYLDVPARDEPLRTTSTNDQVLTPVTTVNPPPPSTFTPNPAASSLREVVHSSTNTSEDAVPLSATTSAVFASAIGPPGLTPAATQRWYVVTVGTNVGVYQGWCVAVISLSPVVDESSQCRDNVRQYVEGVRGNRLVAYSTRELAVAAFSNALRAGEVTIID